MTFAIETREKTAANKKLLMATEMRTLRSIAGYTVTDWKNILLYGNSVVSREQRDHERMSDERFESTQKRDTLTPPLRQPKRWSKAEHRNPKN